MKQLTLLLSFFILAIAGIAQAPTNEWKLPPSLDEISGIAWLKENQLAAINDEKGQLFFLDLDKEDLIDRIIDFGKDADYEGLCWYEEHFYVLKSNGSILSFNSSGDELKSYKRIEAWKGKEFEGMCADLQNDRILISRKNKDKKIKIYAFDVKAKKHLKEPILSIERSSALKNFNCSGIAIHEDVIYLISGPTAQLLEYDLKMNQILKVINLKRDKFVQIEGIAIQPDKELYIASEKSSRKHAYLFHFKSW